MCSLASSTLIGIIEFCSSISVSLVFLTVLTVLLSSVWALDDVGFGWFGGKLCVVSW